MEEDSPEFQDILVVPKVSQVAVGCPCCSEVVAHAVVGVVQKSLLVLQHIVRNEWILLSRMGVERPFLFSVVMGGRTPYL